MNLMIRSLQGRLLALTHGLVASVWLATALFTWIDVRHELDELFDAGGLSHGARRWRRLARVRHLRHRA